MDGYGRLSVASVLSLRWPNVQPERKTERERGWARCGRMKCGGSRLGNPDPSFAPLHMLSNPTPPPLPSSTRERGWRSQWKGQVHTRSTGLVCSYAYARHLSEANMHLTRTPLSRSVPSAQFVSTLPQCGYPSPISSSRTQGLSGRNAGREGQRPCLTAWMSSSLVPHPI